MFQWMQFIAFASILEEYIDIPTLRDEIVGRWKLHVSTSTYIQYKIVDFSPQFRNSTKK